MPTQGTPANDGTETNATTEPVATTMPPVFAAAAAAVGRV
jgi:hypothetical protein